MNALEQFMIVIVVLIMLGVIIFGFVKVLEWSNREDIKSEQKQKAEYEECLIKTSNNLDWCYDKIIIN